MEQRDPKGSQHYSLYAGRRALHKAQESCDARIYIQDDGNASDVAHTSKMIEMRQTWLTNRGSC